MLRLLQISFPAKAHGIGRYQLTDGRDDDDDNNNNNNFMLIPANCNVNISLQ
jgi:hypothetical protein